MKKFVLSFSIMVLTGAVLVLSPAWGLQQDENLSVNPEMTARMQAFDLEDFTQEFDVYAAESLEAPTALLFDRKDDYQLPSRFWGKPISQDEIIYAIDRLKDQYNNNRGGELPFEPRALNVVNAHGKILGYVYTSLKKTGIVMERKEDGNVKVFPPSMKPRVDSSGGGGR